MINEIKLLLGESASNYSDELIGLCYKYALNDVENYCRREADATMEMCADRLAVIRLNRLHSEGLSSQGFSGVSESYIDGFPADIQAILNSKRKIKII